MLLADNDVLQLCFCITDYLLPSPLIFLVYFIPCVTYWSTITPSQ